MKELMYQIPIVLFIYRRPKQTKKVMEVLFKLKPEKMYIIADGPKNLQEENLCYETRSIVNEINWTCEIVKNFSETNLGIRERIISGLDWVFDKEEMAIILEDDCLSEISFFGYCEELLRYYNSNEDVMVVSGNNFAFGKKNSSESYCFTKYAHIWGWATWKRAWKRFHLWNNQVLPIDLTIFNNRHEKLFWLQRLSEVENKTMNYSWGYQWSLTCFAYKGLCICPNVNLVSNIGFGADGTNTFGESKVANMPTSEINLPLIHPKKMVWNRKADRRSSKLSFQIPHESYFLRFIKKIIPRKIRIFIKQKLTHFLG